MAQTAAPDARFKQYDKNSDGKISRDEAKGTAAERSFDRRDQNKDGFLTPDESPRGRTRPRYRARRPLPQHPSRIATSAIGNCRASSRI
jgi:hypothetical protein